MHYVRSIQVMGEQSIELTWSDGKISVVDFGPIIEQGGVFTPLADVAFFGRAALDERGRVVFWPGEIDFCADALFEMGRVPIAR